VIEPTTLRVTAAGLTTAMKDAPGRLAPRPAEPGDDAALREHGLLDDGGLTDAGHEWFEPLRAPTYVFRIERSLAGVEAAQSFYVNLDSLHAIHVLADGDDAFTLTHMPVADVIYSGIIEAAGIWPETHPEAEGEPPQFDEESSLVTTLVVLHDDGEGITEHELSWVEDEGVWLVEDGTLTPSSDHDLCQQIPPLLNR
jgi:hypothetical protein